MIDICNKERAIKVKELIEVLQKCDPEAELVSTIWNGWTNTYCAIDCVQRFTYDELSNDFFGTPGQTDHKVFCSQAQNIVLLCSLFEYDKTLVRDVHENLKEGQNYWKKERSEQQEGNICANREQ